MFGTFIDPQTFWFYVIIAGLVFFGLDVSGRNDLHRFVWRVLISAFWPLFWVVCAAKKL